MKLNADIIYKELSSKYSADITGPRSSTLDIGRPEFYIENDAAFLSGHLYLATVEHLPQRPRIQENCVLVCIGENLSLNYYRDKLCLITIRHRNDFFKVYQALQTIYDKYDAWESAVLRELVSAPDAEKILELSAGIFSSPLYLLDNSFKVAASTAAVPVESWSSKSSGALNSEALSKYLSASDLMTDRKSAIKLDIFGYRTLCVNLFSKYNQYAGCVVAAYNESEIPDGDEALAEMLAGFIQTALDKNPSVLYDTDTTIKKAMQNLIEEQPLSYSQRLLLSSSNRTTIYRCVFLRFSRRNNQLPLSYICNIMEDNFDDSPAFTYDNAVLFFINMSKLSGGKSSAAANTSALLTEKLHQLNTHMGLCAGISNEFSDLFNIRLYYLQARAAYENGSLLSPDEDLFFFEQYALTEMIINSMGGLPAEAYYPAGFAALLEHDKDGPISYVQTLKVFLEENMSYTSTARRLYVHRSTLIDRISRIEKELGIELRNPDERLHLEILLKAMDIEDMLRRN